MTQIAIALLTLLFMVGLEQEVSRFTEYNAKTGASSRPDNERTNESSRPVTSGGSAGLGTGLGCG